MLLPFVTLQPLAALESFSFTVLFTEDSEDHLLSSSEDDLDSEPSSHQFSGQPFLPWCHLLRTAPTSLRLVTITLDCYALYKDTLRDWFDISHSSKWSDLDIILADSERLPLLQKVIIHVNLPEKDWDELDSYHGYHYSSEDDDGSDCVCEFLSESESDSDSEASLLSLEEVAYFIRRNLKLTRRVAIVEVLLPDH
jgi:hypothetical protein